MIERRQKQEAEKARNDIRSNIQTLSVLNFGAPKPIKA